FFKQAKDAEFVVIFYSDTNTSSGEPGKIFAASDNRSSNSGHATAAESQTLGRKATGSDGTTASGTGQPPQMISVQAKRRTCLLTSKDRERLPESSVILVAFFFETDFLILPG